MVRLEVDIVTSAIKKSGYRQSSSPSEAAPIENEVNLRDPILMMEREVLKIKLQYPEMAKDW